MAKKKVVHIYIKPNGQGKVFCGDRSKGVSVEKNNLWAVKKAVLCKKCYEAMEKKGH